MSTSRLLALLIPGILGLPFLAAAALMFSHVALFVASARTASAVFAGSVAKSGGSHGGTFYYPEFTFTPPGGPQVKVRSEFGSTDQPYQDGSRVTVLYNAKDPAGGEVDTFRIWLTPLFLSMPGLLLTGIPAMIFFVGRNREDKASF